MFEKKLYKAGYKEKSLKVLTIIGSFALAEIEIQEITESLKGNSVAVTIGELFKPSSRRCCNISFINKVGR